MTVATDIDKVRLEIGDRDSEDPLFYDDEIDYFLDAASNDVLTASARACDSLARRFAREYSFSTDGQSFDKGERSAHYAALAKELRQRTAGGVTSSSVTRVDGYSQDIPADRVTHGRGGSDVGRGNFYTQNDRVF